MIETWKHDTVEQLPRERSSCDKKRAAKSVKCSKMDLQLDVRHVELQVAQRALPDTAIYASSSEEQSPDHTQSEFDGQKVDVMLSYESSRSSTLQLSPCKVLTRLAKDPSADITQVVDTGDVIDERVEEGVECSKAHAMLMQLANSEDKLEVISQALERGCVGKPGGGCSVRKEAIWKAMEDVI